MAENPINPGNPIDSGRGKPLDAERLLLWIDGQLSASEQAGVEADSGRPGLSARVAQMQANARALRSVGLEQAPPQLASRVLAALERESLVSTGDRVKQVEGDDRGPMPISFTDHVSVRSGGGWSKAAPAFALAAGLALLVGGGAYWSTLLFRPATPGQVGPGPVALNDTRALVPEESAEVGDRGLAKAESDRALAATATTGLVDEAGLFVGPLQTPMTTERALKLAGEGRLAVRVKAGSVRLLRQVEAAGAGKSGRAWRLTRSLPPEVTLALAPGKSREEPLMASSNSAELLAPYMGPNAVLSVWNQDDPLRHVKGAYVLEVPSEVSALESVNALLAEKLQGEVELEELQTPLVAGAAHPERVLWWTQPSTYWTPRVSVPVIVEMR